MRSIIQIFSSGTHTPMNGPPIVFSSAELERTAKTYNERHRRAAPLVLGHPPDDRPAYGDVRALFSASGALFAEVEPNEDLRAWVRSGRYKKVSAAFFTPKAADNPVPGVYFLRHVGFLGAQLPAVKGMRDPVFAEADGTLRFAEGSASGSSAVDLDRPAINRIEALQQASAGRLSFAAAAMALGY